MHHHARIAQGDDPLGLIAMSEKGAGHGLAHQQRDHRVPGQPCAGIAIHRAGEGLMNAEGFFAAAIGLARHVDHGDHHTLVRLVAIGRNHLVQRLAQSPAFEQTDLAIARARKGLSASGTTAI